MIHLMVSENCPQQYEKLDGKQPMHEQEEGSGEFMICHHSKVTFPLIGMRNGEHG